MARPAKTHCSSGWKSRPGKRRSARKQTPGGRRDPTDRSGVSKALEREGSKPAGRNKDVNVIASSYYQPKGDWEGRAAHDTAKATDSTPEPERVLDFPGVPGGGTLGKSSVEQERPYPAVESDKGRGYKAGRLKSHGAGRESERFVVPEKACKKTRWREGTLLWSRRQRGKREGMPEMANTPFVKARQLGCPAMGAIQVSTTSGRNGEGSYNRHDNPEKGRIKWSMDITNGSSRRSSVSRVRENRTHGLKGGV
jgi:hypothetical protein